MLRVVASKNAGQAKSYYGDGLSREDYYSEGQEIAGQWGGRAAERLGLAGQVDKVSFDALCDNINPATGERLTARTDAHRTIGYDLNFHCPKSVSALHAMTGDEFILSAFRVAVRETMEDIEADMLTRVRKGGKEENRLTGNFAYAEFVHLTSRPAQSTGQPDPHLHAHCYVFNATYDTVEEKFKAGQFREIKRDAPFYEAAFHSRLAGNLAALGYGIERTAKGWEVAGVPKSVIDKFSHRTQEIEAAAKEQGIISAKAKDQLGAKTRRGKQKGVGMESLRAEWAARLTPDERAALAGAWEGGGTSGSPVIGDRQAMDYALAHVFERHSVVGDRELMAVALRHGVGSVTVDGVRREAARGDVLACDMESRKFVTTKNVLAEEQAMIGLVRDGRGEHRRLGNKSFRFQDERLNGEQRAAVMHVLRSQDFAVGIRGGAGTGKTTLTREAVRGIEEKGKRVLMFAPSSDASRKVLREAGFKDAETVAMLLSNKELQQQIKGQVIWIDEAGQMGSREMGQVLSLAKEQNARVVLAGDVRQHASVTRGDALRLLETKSGMKTAQVNEIQRQRGDYKKAVERLSRGDVAGGFEGLDKLGAMVELPDDQRYKALARDYVDAAKKGRDVLALSPTHAEGARVTDAIRAEMKAAGKLKGAERTFTKLESLQYTEAQRGDARHYQAGQVVKFVQGAPGFKTGQQVKVADVSAAGVTVSDAAGRMRALPLDQAARFQVYRESTITLAVGDKIRITQGGYTLPDKKGKDGHRLNNGTLYGVAGFTPEGHIKLDNKWTMRKDFGTVSHGYCGTSHSSQGKSPDVILIAQSAVSAPAASREQFYVSVSRGKETIRIFTDDKQAVKAAVMESGQRMSATELMERAGKARAGQGLEQRAERVKHLARLARTHAARAVEAVKETAKEHARSWAARVNKPRREREMER